MSDIKLAPQRFAGAEYERQEWVVTVEPGTTKAQIENPMFWSHVSAKMRPYDRVEIRCDDGTFYAEALVIACERTWAKIKILGWQSLTTADVAASQAAEPAAAEVAQTSPRPAEGFEVAWKGPHKKHCVIRTADREVIHEGEQTKAAAQAWLVDYIKVVA